MALQKILLHLLHDLSHLHETYASLVLVGKLHIVQLTDSAAGQLNCWYMHQAYHPIHSQNAIDACHVKGSVITLMKGHKRAQHYSSSSSQG